MKKTAEVLEYVARSNVELRKLVNVSRRIFFQTVVHEQIPHLFLNVKYVFCTHQFTLVSLSQQFYAECNKLFKCGSGWTY